jgi:hypothetical protein
MGFPSCSLWILVARTDLPFMMETIPHLVKMSNFPFCDRVLAVDTAPLSGEKINRPGVGTMEELRDRVDKLIKAGVVDRSVDVNYSSEYRDRVYRKHFGSPLKLTHNYKGYPILGTIFTIEEAALNSDYMLHYDSDMLLHQKPNYSWLHEAIEMMENNPDIIAHRPLTGPPTHDGSLSQTMPYHKDDRGFYSFKFFSSRLYLINCKRFDKILPLPILWRSYRNQWLNHLPLSTKTSLNNLTGKGLLDSWEIMVSQQLEKTEYVRATSSHSLAWTLHPKDRSPKFIEALPRIIEKIELGHYPEKQSGHYDLISDIWY